MTALPANTSPSTGHPEVSRPCSINSRAATPAPEVSELHERLQALGFLAQLPDAYEDATHDTVASFQRSRGLDVSGVCDPHTWRALLEAEHQFGARALYLSSPMLRGDDVATSSSTSGSLGFNAGRVEWNLLGPNTQQAVREFQRNTDLMVDGVCARDTVSQLNRLTARSSNISIAGIHGSTIPSRAHPTWPVFAWRCATRAPTTGWSAR